jgi:hypothetical protein
MGVSMLALKAAHIAEWQRPGVNRQWLKRLNHPIHSLLPSNPARRKTAYEKF